MSNKNAKWITGATVLLFSVFLQPGCDKFNQPQPMYAPDDDHRGVWGCGIPCPGVELPPIDAVCNKPNGVCEYALLMPEVSTSELENSGMRINVMDGGDRIRYEFLNPKIQSSNDLDEESYIRLRKLILDDIGASNEQYADTIADYLLSHYFIPNDIPYSDESSKLILKSKNLKGNRILVKSGEYEIKRNADYPNGYFDLNIEID